MGDTTDMEKLRILTMWECGKSTTEIAKSVNKSARTVQRWLAHQKREGNMDKKPRGLRPRKTTPEEDARIIQLVQENPELTQKEILTICNLNIYKGTLRRRLQEANGICKLELFPTVKQKKKPKKPKTEVFDSLKDVSDENLLQHSSTDLLKTDISDVNLLQHASTETLLNTLISEDSSNIETKEFEFVESQQVFTDANHFVNADSDLFTFTESVIGKDDLQPDIIHEVENVYDEFASIQDNVKVKVEMLDVDKMPMSMPLAVPIILPSDLDSNNIDFNVDESVLKRERKSLRKSMIPSISDDETVETQQDLPGVLLSRLLSDNVQAQNMQVEEVETVKTSRKRRSCNEAEPNYSDGNSQGCEVQSLAKLKKRGRRCRNIEKVAVKREKKKRVKKERAEWEKDRKDTTDIEKNKILIMDECGMTTEEIARALKKSRRTVQRWISKHNHGLDMDKKERGRRPRKTTPDEDARIVQLVKEHPTLSRKQILSMANINLHKVTLKSRLNEAGMYFNSQGVKILDFSGDSKQGVLQDHNHTAYDHAHRFMDVDDRKTTIITCSSLTPTPAITSAILACPTLSTTLIITNPCDDVVSDSGQNSDAPGASGCTFPDYSMY